MTLSGRASSSPSRKRAARLLSMACFVALVGCNAPEPTPGSSQTAGPEHSYLTPRYLGEAIDKLLGPLPKPVRVLSLTALHRVVVVQVQSPQHRGSVLEYRFAEGNVTGPVPVELKGPGKLADNLFRVDSFDPHVAEMVLAAVRSEYSEEVRKLVISRNLPNSMDIQFRVFLKTTTGDRIVVADKGGRLLGPLTTAPPPPNVSSPTPP